MLRCAGPNQSRERQLFEQVSSRATLAQSSSMPCVVAFYHVVKILVLYSNVSATSWGKLRLFSIHLGLAVRCCTSHIAAFHRDRADLSPGASGSVRVARSMGGAARGLAAWEWPKGVGVRAAR